MQDDAKVKLAQSRKEEFELNELEKRRRKDEKKAAKLGRKRRAEEDAEPRAAESSSAQAMPGVPETDARS